MGGCRGSHGSGKLVFTSSRPQYHIHSSDKKQVGSLDLKDHAPCLPRRGLRMYLILVRCSSGLCRSIYALGPTAPST